ncbi:PspC domain-containing protein [Anditalea andensis]|uniref:Phage-shock protein n=1 Tax=Anditalea andensis TaxID=1048983 RepID=A0A074L3Y2_9BACT|nr:PspC domain-containing protein [Anditalea andensis]KEO75135.1 phage-shock protein [Anditalea andensis]
MKKTISINISGILFHIEEDGYTALKKYLEAINTHFSNYEGNQEIINDIENRIAEIFLSTLKNNKQVITSENVEMLIEKMGTIADFQASEETLNDTDNKDEKVDSEYDFYKNITPPMTEAGKGYKRLSRLENRKILGGVCAGIAHYLAIDPLWTRLIAILLLFSGRINFPGLDWFPGDWLFKISLAGWAVLAYVVLWAILPVSYEDIEDKNIKKLYRNPDDRVIGGVGSGLAAYFNIEIIWVRILFLALLFAGGSGLVIYLILWIITPVAKSITERIEMKGGAITLSNIENTILENQHPPYAKEESKGRKMVLAPFRVMGNAIDEIGKALGPFGKFLLTIFRVLFGALIFLIGISLIFTCMIFLGTYFHIIHGETFGLHSGDIPMDFITETVPFWLAVAVVMTIVIPALIITIMGVSIWVRRNLINGRIGLFALVIWLISIAIVGFSLPHTISQFSSEAEINETTELAMGEGTMVIRARDTQQEINISAKKFGDDEVIFNNTISLKLSGHNEDKVKLIQKFTSRGKSQEDARANLREIEYAYEIQDSILLIDKNIQLTSWGKFRAQSLDQELLIPYNRPFIIEKSVLSVLQHTLYRNGYKLKDVNSRNIWVFNENGLLCLTCTSDHKNTEADIESRELFQNLTIR